MPSSEHEERLKAETAIVFSVLKKLPDEINGGLLVAIIINILCKYAMEEEWEKIVDAVNETMEDISGLFIFTPEEVRLN
jgi:hypothetical protein